jgi:hypothetical protein
MNEQEMKAIKSLIETTVDAKLNDFSNSVQLNISKLQKAQQIENEMMSAHGFGKVNQTTESLIDPRSANLSEFADAKIQTTGLAEILEHTAKAKGYNNIAEMVKSEVL